MGAPPSNENADAAIIHLLTGWIRGGGEHQEVSHALLLYRLGAIEEKLDCLNSAGPDPAVAARLDGIIETLSRLESKMSRQTDALAALADVEKKLEADEALEEAQVQSLQAEVADLKQKLADAPVDDTDQLNALNAQIAALDARIVAARTAAAPPVDAVPPATAG